MVVDENMQILQIRSWSLKRGATWSMSIKSDACLHAIYGEGAGCILNVAGGAAGVWIPLRGALQVHCNGLKRLIHAGDVLITEIDDDIKAIGKANGKWLTVLGCTSAWDMVLTDQATTSALLFPDLHRADGALRHTAIALARASTPIEREGAVLSLSDQIANLQAPLRRAMARCPGRTLARKRQIFLRLQHVRNYIGAFCNQDLDNETLALMANFSPCYFLRTFKAVYLETPHAYLIDQRLQRARRLLHSSNLAITEVALASGFENRCVFSRTFHKHFGMTADEAKHHKDAYAIA
ncbi:MAG: helix-turn-helix transcriptional regulator [Rhodanobacteraceae bacterium]